MKRLRELAANPSINPLGLAEIAQQDCLTIDAAVGYVSLLERTLIELRQEKIEEIDNRIEAVNAHIATLQHSGDLILVIADCSALVDVYRDYAEALRHANNNAVDAAVDMRRHVDLALLALRHGETDADGLAEKLEAAAEDFDAHWKTQRQLKDNAGNARERAVRFAEQTKAKRNKVLTATAAK